MIDQVLSSDCSPVIVAARRSPVRSVRGTGTAARTQLRLSQEDLAAPVLAALAEDVAALGTPSEVIFGSACPAPGNLARRATLAAGLPDQVAAMTVDRQCGSGLDAIRTAAGLIAMNGPALILAGGVESVSSSGVRQAPFAPPGVIDPGMAQAADALAARLGIARARQDDYTARSYALAAQAAAEGRFADELVPLQTPLVLTHDDRPRRLAIDTLGRLPAIGPGGVTVATTAGSADAAAAIALTSVGVARAHGLAGLRVVATAAVGVDPAEPAWGPVPAIRQLLERSQVCVRDLAVIEIVEAFAAQQLACLDALGLDPFGADAHRVSPDGGALGLGHPWGASGAMAVLRVFARLVRRGQGSAGALGLVACAVAGGQGVAMLLEQTG